MYRLPPKKRFEPVYPTVKMAPCSPFNKCCYQHYSDNNDFIMSETNGSVGVVIILLLNAFEQSAILTVSYVTCKASIPILDDTRLFILCRNRGVCW